jgi:hypothetical protein
MKRITTLFISLGISLAGIAQNIGIGTSTPNASALLDLQSTNKGLLLPRVADTNAVASPAKGLVIYSTTANALFYYNGSSWQTTANSGSADLWYKYQDSVLVTDKEYVSINPSPVLNTPLSGLSVTGNLLIQPKVVASNTPPTAAQTLTMNNTSSLQSISSNDSVGRIFDPGGQNVNYFNNMQGNYIVLGATNGLGTTLSFNKADFGIAPGDTLWIGYNRFPSCRTDYVSMLTNTSVPPSNIDLIGSNAYIIFRSNSDGANSKGFDISWKRIYQNIQKKNNTSDAFGNALVFKAEDGSFRTGSPGLKLGESATCLGCLVATGAYSFATANSSAIGSHSTAMGDRSIASGDNAVAIGDRNEAAAFSSIAIGHSSTAAGFGSLAIGRAVNAGGDFSSALGLNTTALSFSSTALGYNNDTFPGTSKTMWVNTDPLIYFGNGFPNRSNAMVIYKNANVDINGYTRLGKLSEGAPEIKMKKFTGISSSSQNGFTDVTHGLNRAKIIGVQVIMKLPGFVDLGPGSRVNSGYEYEFQVLDNIIRIANLNGNSANILSKNFVVLVTYEE